MKHGQLFDMVLTFLLALAFLFNMTPVQDARAEAPAGLCYVRAATAGPNDGNPWMDAYNSLLAALGNAACSGR